MPLHKFLAFDRVDGILFAVLALYSVMYVVLPKVAEKRHRQGNTASAIAILSWIISWPRPGKMTWAKQHVELQLAKVHLDLKQFDVAASLLRKILSRRGVTVTQVEAAKLLAQCETELNR